MYYLKAILVILISFLISTNTACNKEQNKNEEKVFQNTELAQAPINNTAENKSLPANLGKVLYINSVSKPVTGKATDFTWNDGNKTIRFSEYTKNKVVFLNFWGTWCGPCKREIPDLIEISKELSGKDFVMIGIALEGRTTPEQAHQRVSKFVEEKQIPYLNFIGVAEIQLAYGGINSIPTTFIIDKDGNIVETIIGARDKATFMKSINKVLK